MSDGDYEHQKFARNAFAAPELRISAAVYLADRVDVLVAEREALLTHQACHAAGISANAREMVDITTRDNDWYRAEQAKLVPERDALLRRVEEIEAEAVDLRLQCAGQTPAALQRDSLLLRVAELEAYDRERGAEFARQSAGWHAQLEAAREKIARLEQRCASLDAELVDGDAYSLGRADERAAVVAWLRDRADDLGNGNYWAHGVEAGEHVKP